MVCLSSHRFAFPSKIDASVSIICFIFRLDARFIFIYVSLRGYKNTF